MKILVVDDEPLARDRLMTLISELVPTHTVLTAKNGLEAMEMVGENAPDLLLLDIRMPGMDGIETAYHLTQLENPPAVVFTTAHQDHAIQAFEANAVDYLLKPVKRERLKEAVAKAELVNRARLINVMDKEEMASSRGHLCSTNRGKLELIPVNEIGYMKAEQKYVSIGWKGRELLIDESLKKLEKEFSDRFLRVHRNALISKQHIVSLDKSEDDSHKIMIKEFDAGISVSRRHLQEVRRYLKSLG
jgi:two-component system response regulator AlgR